MTQPTDYLPLHQWLLCAIEAFQEAKKHGYQCIIADDNVTITHIHHDTLFRHLESEIRKLTAESEVKE